MDSYNDTDAEFWKDLDNPTPVTQRPAKILEQQISKFKSKNPSQSDKLTLLLTRAREAAKQHYKDKLNVYLHKQAQFFESKIQSIKESHIEEINDLLRKFWKLDETLINRDDHISNLQRFFVAQETELALTRIKSSIKDSEETSKKDENSEINKEIIHEQLSVFKELAAGYENDINKLKNQIKDMESQIKEIENKHLMEILDMKKKIERTQNDCKKKLRDVNQKYLSFRNDVGTEFDLKDMIIKKQGENISRLKQEIFMAKSILDTPRLLFKYNAAEPYRQKHSKSLNSKPVKSNMTSKSVLKQRKFDSNETLGSTRATPIFTMTPEPEHSYSFLPTLSESSSNRRY